MSNEIAQGNKLITEFMGLKIGDAWQVWNSKADYSKDADFEYHTSWDWLMPVVNKIEAIHHIREHNYVNVRISQGYVEIEGIPGVKIFRNASIEGSKIKATWLAVIEFIKWYNQNQSK